MGFEDALLLAAGFVVGAGVIFLARLFSGAGSAAPVAQTIAQEADDGQLEQILDQLDLGIIWLDDDRRVTRLNPAAARLVELDPKRALGRSLMETFLDHRVEEQALVAAAQGSAMLEITQRGDEDHRLLIRLRRAPEGGLRVFLEDVTELRRLQRIRSEFIDNLSHELRTPLTTIRLLTETLSQDVARPDVNVPPRMRDRIVKIDIETGHLAQMVTELLDLSRIEGGASELHFENFRIAEAVNAAIERLRTFAERQRVGLESEIANDLPLAWGDEERIGQVLVNLLHNAVKFSPPESLVTVSAALRDGQIAVTVRDQGAGIAKQNLDRVFERFYKVDKARQRGQGGTGLGLSIARHIVEGHGGRIWAESEEGRGSAFTFTVPVANRPGG
jgi:two-component system phosphate regulon sensor histidine kinase PhoR